MEGELEPLGDVRGEIEERLESGALVIEVPAGTVVHPFSAEPVCDRREWRARHGAVGRPGVERHARGCVYPAETSIREERQRGSHRLANGEVQIVRRHGQIPLGHPCLEQPRVDVDERRAPKAPDQVCRQLVHEIDEYVGVGG